MNTPACLLGKPEHQIGQQVDQQEKRWNHSDEGQYTEEEVAHRDLAAHPTPHEQRDPDRRGHETKLDHHDQRDPEPDRVETQRHDDRKGHWQGHKHHGDRFHEHAIDKVEDQDHEHDRPAGPRHVLPGC